MNELLWGVQILLAGGFLFTAAGKLFDYDQLVSVIEIRSKGRPIGISRWQATLVGIAEVLGALGVLVPGRFDPAHRIACLSAAGLTTLMIAAIIYHRRRDESVLINLIFLLLALIVMAGRLPFRHS